MVAKEDEEGEEEIAIAVVVMVLVMVETVEKKRERTGAREKEERETGEGDQTFSLRGLRNLRLSACRPSEHCGNDLLDPLSLSRDAAPRETRSSLRRRPRRRWCRRHGCHRSLVVVDVIVRVHSTHSA